MLTLIPTARTKRVTLSEEHDAHLTVRLLTGAERHQITVDTVLVLPPLDDPEGPETPEEEVERRRYVAKQTDLQNYTQFRAAVTDVTNVELQPGVPFDLANDDHLLQLRGALPEKWREVIELATKLESWTNEGAAPLDGSPTSEPSSDESPTTTEGDADPAPTSPGPQATQPLAPLPGVASIPANAAPVPSGQVARVPEGS